MPTNFYKESIKNNTGNLKNWKMETGYQQVITYIDFVYIIIALY
jgi:hypothetical protein